MLSPLSHSKVRPDHLTRPALVYIRQSTLMQVRTNTASTARQYQLTQRARELGWPEQLIVVLDQDQGRPIATCGPDNQIPVGDVSRVRKPPTPHGVLTAQVKKWAGRIE